MDEYGMEFEALSIQSLVNSLKTIQGEDTKVYHLGNIVPYSFILNPPASLERIRAMEEELKVRFPKDLVTLLSNMDGMEFGNWETQISSLDDSQMFYSTCDNYLPNMIVIATVEGASVHIVLEIKDDGSYGIYYTDAIGDNKLWHLGNDLLQFLDALVTSYGAPYWKWSKQTEVYIEKINVD